MSGGGLANDTRIYLSVVKLKSMRGISVGFAGTSAKTTADTSDFDFNPAIFSASI